MFYYGTYHRNLDPKGRLLIPGKLTQENATEVYVLRGHEGCLAVYDGESFQKAMEKYASMDFEDPIQRAKMRMAFASVHPTKIDRVGRILLGAQILQDYGMKEKVTLIGCFDHFEIWDEEAYARYLLANGSLYDLLPSGRMS